MPLPPPRQLRFDLGRAPPLERDDFVVSPANLEAVRMLDAWPEWRAGCLTLVGPEACGKTHLASIWAAETGAVRAGSAPLSELRGRPVLLEGAERGVDDETLFHLIEMAAEPGGGLLMTSRLLPLAWSSDLPDLRSRLNALPVAQIDAPDDRVLEGALRRFFEARHITPAEEIYPYLLARMERSVPRAWELVAMLDDAALERGQAVSRALARQILEIDGETPDLFP
ncbi:MAG: DnaA-related protein [Caulobacter sp.]|nr:DnaA-related protein [Caulobacter sp.]